MKKLLLLLLILLPGVYFGCDCNGSFTFCSHSDSVFIAPTDVEESVFMITINRSNFYDYGVGSKKVYDCPIVDQFFGPKLPFDSVSILPVSGSCNVAFEDLGDTLLIKKSVFLESDKVNYPLVIYRDCLADIVSFQEGFVVGNIFNYDGSYYDRERIPFDEFLERYEYECSETAYLPDLDELKGVELIQNPIFSNLLLKNNLDKEVSFEIYSLNGEYISKGSIPANTLFEAEVSTLSQGVYLVRVNDGIGEKFQKVLKL